MRKSTSVSSSSGVDLSKKYIILCGEQKHSQTAQNVSSSTQLQQLSDTLVSNESFSAVDVKSVPVYVPAFKTSVSLNDGVQSKKSATIIKIKPDVLSEAKQEVTIAAGSKDIKSHDDLPHAFTSQNNSALNVESHFFSNGTCSYSQEELDKAFFKMSKAVYHPNRWSLYISFFPCLKEIIIRDPESIPFRKPVNISQRDYYDLIKQPIDLTTIKNKLESGEYPDGWSFIDDVWLMFKNAWLYYRKKSRPYKYCTTLSQLFKSLIDEPMQKFGYCCGQYHEFEPRNIRCYNKINCAIQKYDKYWSYDDRYAFCKKCFDETNGNISLSSSDETLIVEKDKFVEKKNDVSRKELFVKCIRCNKSFHKICVLHLEEIWKDGFLCNICLKERGKKKKIPDIFTSENLPRTKLGCYIEKRVKMLLEERKCSSKVIVRVVYQERNIFEVRQATKLRFVNWPEYFPYTAKALLAFQKIDGVDVCFFALYVHEYDTGCPPPNTRHVYLAYLDSVNFFTPKELRTSVYYEILLGYMDYVRTLGYTTVHLWSCPSSKGEDYIFFCHPEEQKSQSIKRLQEWYKTMLDQGIKDGIVKSYKSLYKQALEDNIQSAAELPYLEGDYWPTTIENEILKLEGRAAKVTCRSMKMTMLKAEDKEDKEITELVVKKTKNKKNKNLKNFRNSLCSRTDDLLTDKIYSLMSKHKEVFLVINLCPARASADSVINDPDPSMPSGIMSSRESLLDLCKEKDCEFSSLRRAKYSTMVLLYELYKERVVPVSCNLCKDVLQTGFHCPICKDFDLCSECFSSEGHDHSMEELNVESESKSYDGYEEILSKNLNSLPSWGEIFQHVSCCKDGNCSKHFCRDFRLLENHAQKDKLSRKCRYCWLIIVLSYEHHKVCQYNMCHIYVCRIFKEGFKRQKDMHIKPKKSSALQLSPDSTSSVYRIPQNNFQLPDTNLSQNNFKEDRSQVHACIITAPNHAVNGLPLASQFKNEASACRSNYTSLSDVSAAMNTAHIYSTTNDGQTQKFEIVTLPKYVSSSVVNIKQELSSVVLSNNGCSISRNMTKLSHPLRNAKPSFQSTNFFMLLNKQKLLSNSDISPVSRNASEINAAQTSFEISEQDIPVNDINLQLCPSYSSHIANSEQKSQSQNVFSDTDSKKNLKNLLHSGGFSVESNQLHSWNNRNEQMPQMQTKSNFKSLFSLNTVNKNKLNSQFNGSSLTRKCLPGYPLYNSTKPVSTSQHLEIASDASCLSNKSETKIHCSSYQASDNFPNVTSDIILCSKNSHQDVNNPQKLVYLNTPQSSKPIQFNNNSLFSPQIPSPIVEVDSRKSRETHLQDSFFTEAYTGIKEQEKIQVNQNVSNLEVKNVGAHVSGYSPCVFSSEQNPVDLANKADKLGLFQIPQNLMPKENYDGTKMYPKFRMALNECKQTITEPVQIFTQPADTYIPYDDDKSKDSYSPSCIYNSTSLPANIKVEKLDRLSVNSDATPNITNVKYSVPYTYNSRLKLSSDESQASYSESLNSVSPIQENFTYENNNKSELKMCSKYKSEKSYQSNFTKHLYKDHRAPISSQHHTLSSSNPQKYDSFMECRAFQQHQLKKPMLQNSRRLPNTVQYSNWLNQQLPTMPKNALSSASALQTSIQLPSFQYFCKLENN